jgi:hypothetical protein
MGPMQLVGFGLAAMLVLIFLGIGFLGFMEPTSQAMMYFRQVKNDFIILILLIVFIAAVFGGKKKD